MLKQTFFCILSCVFILFLSSHTVDAQIIFPDVPLEHWAYSYIMDLVNDGTVKGFEDGEFKPGNTVSRAEFVKMIGNGNEKRNRAYTDVDPSHWAYEYIMYSGLEDEGGFFKPDVSITRNDVINLIWKRNEGKIGVVAPSVIKDQGSNEDAVAWGYTYGIMIGDDGLHMRLGDGLTRAEAAALIIRARQVDENSEKKNFVDTVSPDILKRVISSIKLFEEFSYDADKTVTFGEMARAAVCLGAEEFIPTYQGYFIETPFAHKYAQDIYVVGNYCIGAEKINPDFADKPASVKDTLTALTYNMIRKSREPVKYGATGNYYGDIGEIDNVMMDICLTFGYENGVHLYADGFIRADGQINMKEFACLLLQLDYLIGSQSEITTDYIGNIQVSKNARIRKNLSSYPGNYADFQCILENVPNEAYAPSFADNAANNLPSASYDFAREYSFLFTDMLGELKNISVKDTSVKLRFTYYPSLVCNNGNGATLRVKCEILENPQNLSLKDIFKNRLSMEEEFSAQAGTSIYMDIITGQPLSDVYLSSETIVIKQIVHIESK